MILENKDQARLEGLLEQLGDAFTSIPFNRMLGLALDHVELNYASMNFSMQPELIGNYLQGILHGGVISSVLDMAGGIVVMATAVLENIHRSDTEIANILGRTSTIDLHVSYLNPGRGDKFTAKAWLIKRGTKISFTRMELLNEDGTLIASGNAVYRQG